MRNLEYKVVQKKKKNHFNIYGVNGRVFCILTSVTCALIIVSVLQLLIEPMPPTACVLIDISIIVSALAFAFLRDYLERVQIDSYKRQKDFEFIGLYDISGSKSLKEKDILSRDEEVRYLGRMLEELIFPQEGVKQAICLTGKSGCGKTTILSFFKQKYGDQYEIIDLTGNYTNLQTALTEQLGTNLDEKLLEMTRHQKVLFLFDQFERYFFLDEAKKAQFRNLMKALSRKNTGIILSMREEYLADFLKEFDINDLKQDKRCGENYLHAGILNQLTSSIRDGQKNYHIAKAAQNRRLSVWKNEKIKENYYVHLEHTGNYSEKTMLEAVGNTVFYCENQNDIRMQSNGMLETASVLQSKCERLFGDDGTKFYEKHKQEPLIQQQITYHMAEYEKKVKQLSGRELRELFAKEDYELLNDYFDTQLASAGDYFNASRILYLLSSARLNHMVMKKKDLEFGLFADQFSREGHKEIPLILEKLEERQLIRKSIACSDQEYEIAHDFIAQAFLNYSYSNMNRNVKSALDIYMAEYMDTGKKNYIEKKREHFDKVQKSNYYTILFVVFALLTVGVDCIVRFVWNPWHGLWKQGNLYGDFVTFFPLLMTEVCILYLYHIYHKILRYYRGKKEVICKIVYAAIMAGSVLTDLCYPHGMALYGILLTVMGMNCVFLLDGSYQKASRQELRDYGLKCSLIGVAYTAFHFVAWGFNTQFPMYIILMEMVMMCILVAYAYGAHMTKEYLYARMMDAGSERISRTEKEGGSD